MAATVLFINRNDLVKNTIIDGNVQAEKLMHFIKIAQEIHIQNFLGTKLYDKITLLINTDAIGGTVYETLLIEYVQPMLIHYAMMDFLPFAAYTVKNGGIFRHISENAESVEKNEVDYLVEKERNLAEYYTRRFIQFMDFNQNSYPEYTSNTNNDIYPDRDEPTFQGWVL
jgi:hypothetical protein|tara:strand:+ start:849 stop:1358 length:510 start_codon:yes stop_codon:yes gene_type:complete